MYSDRQEKRKCKKIPYASCANVTTLMLESNLKKVNEAPEAATVK